jgi:alkylation response protein AidB-like acyl-CoA dehydrogenase
MYDLHLSSEQSAIRDTVRDFVAQALKPVALKAERLDACDRSLLVDVLDRASQLGLRTLALSEELGGAGADALTSSIVTEELAAGDADVAATLAETSALGHLLFDRLTMPSQRERFLPSFLADDRSHLAWARRRAGAIGVNYHRPVVEEAPAGPTASRGGNDWIINGTAECVANAPVAKLIAVDVACDAPGGARTFLVARDTPGLTIDAQAADARWHHGPCGALTFMDCRVSADDLLASDGAMMGTADARYAVQHAAVNLGIGRAAYEAALDYAKLRIQGGRRIIEHQAIGTKLAEIAIRLQVARAAVRHAAWACDHPEAYADRSLDDLPLATIAQVFTAEAIYHAAKDAAEVFGAMGVMRDMPLQKYVHAALVCLHADHGSGDAKLAIAEVLAGYRRPLTASVLAAE